MCRSDVGVSGADTGRRFVSSAWNTVSGTPQTLFLRTNLVHGMGQKSGYEVGPRVSFIGHVLPLGLSTAFIKLAWISVLEK